MRGAFRETAAIKVLIVGMQGLLASVVRETLDAEPDMDVVGQLDAIGDADGALRQVIDVVVTVPTPAGIPAALKSLLFEPRPLPLVAISADGDRIDVFGRSVRHGQGLDGLTGLIRDAVAVARPQIGG